MQAHPFQPFPDLSTSRLLLRQPADADIPALYFLRSDPGVLAYLDREPAASLEEAGQFLQLIREQEQKMESITWALSRKPDTALIGTLCFWNISHAHRRAEIGYGLHPDHQGQGLMQEALEAVLYYGFRVLGFHSVEARVNPNNKASISLLGRQGFIREGYFREDFFFRGRFIDTAVYSLLAPPGEGILEPPTDALTGAGGK